MSSFAHLKAWLRGNVQVHPSQLMKVEGRVTWDRAFATVNRIPFQVPEEVSWAQMMALLVGFLPGLNPRHLAFLGNKLGIDGDIEYTTVPMDVCTMLPIPNLTFSFWEWFSSTAQLIKVHANDIWWDGHIAGFISRHKCAKLLSQYPPGTFLLRFSETIKGGISMSCVDLDPYGTPVVVHLHPWGASDLVAWPLADRLCALASVCFPACNLPTLRVPYFTHAHACTSNYVSVF